MSRYKFNYNNRSLLRTNGDLFNKWLKWVDLREKSARELANGPNFTTVENAAIILGISIVMVNYYARYSKDRPNATKRLNGFYAFPKFTNVAGRWTQVKCVSKHNRNMFFIAIDKDFKEFLEARMSEPYRVKK